MYFIYKGTFENGKVYIGITDNFERRLEEHKRGIGKLDRKGYPIYKAISKYGWDSINWEIIDTVSSLEGAKSKEIKLISEYDSYNKGGYNITKGGDYPSKVCYKVSDEDVDNIKRLLVENKLTMQEVSDKYNIAKSLVSMICNGKRRGNVVIKRKKMARRGSDNGFSKLKEEDVVCIKKKLISGSNRSELVIEFKVSKSTIQGIAIGETWGHVEPKIPMKKKRNKVTKDLMLEVKSQLENKVTSAAIQKSKGVSPNTIVKIKKGFYDHLLE